MYNIKTLAIKVIIIILFLLAVAVIGYIAKLKFNLASYEKNIATLQSEIITARYQLEKQNLQIERLKVDVEKAEVKLTDEIKKIKTRYQNKISLLDKNYNDSCESEIENIAKIYKEWVERDANQSD